MPADLDGGAELADRAVCVTGMHRSGTSMATRALDLLGASLGDPAALMPPGRDNPAGYWENRYVKELDDELLGRLGGSWDRPPVLTAGWAAAPELDDLRERARAVLDESFAAEPAGSVRVWKDPRLSLLLPFWCTVTPVDRTVVVVRHPLEVSASLQARNAMSPAQAALLWLRYVLAALAQDGHHLVVRYDELFADLPATLLAMAAHVGLPRPEPDRLEAVAAHLDPELRHHRAGSDEPIADPVSAMAVAVWADGRIDPSTLDPATARAVAEGWLRPPSDDDALTTARGRVSELTEQLRRRNRELRALTASSGPATPSAPQPAPAGGGPAGALTGPGSG